MILYDETWLFPLLFRIKGSVYLRSCVFALPGAILTWLFQTMDVRTPEFRVDWGLINLSEGVVWSASTGIMLTVIFFRTRQAYSRFWEGTGLLHQMKGEWFDTVSNCVTFSIAARKGNNEAVERFRHTIVRLMSLCHASALEEISGMDTELPTIDVHGLSLETLRHLKECVEIHGFNKVEVLLHLIQSLITQAHEDAILKVPPPILSRVYQTCSRGYVNLLNTKKITDTKFPFPVVQLIIFLLLINTVLTPLVFSALLTGQSSAILLTFMVLFGAYSLNFISIELENPFGDDDNDLPLFHFQSEMNSCLLMLLHWNTDIIAETSPQCIFDFEELCKTVYIPDKPARGEVDPGICQRFRISFLGSSSSGSISNGNGPGGRDSPRMSPRGLPAGVRPSRRLSEVDSEVSGDPINGQRISLRSGGDISAVSAMSAVSMPTVDSQQTTQSPGSPQGLAERALADREARRQAVPILRIAPASPMMQESPRCPEGPRCPDGPRQSPRLLESQSPRSGGHSARSKDPPSGSLSARSAKSGGRSPRLAAVPGFNKAPVKVTTFSQQEEVLHEQAPPEPPDPVPLKDPHPQRQGEEHLNTFLQRSVEDFNQSFKEWSQRIEHELKSLNKAFSAPCPVSKLGALAGQKFIGRTEEL